MCVFMWPCTTNLYFIIVSLCDLYSFTFIVKHGYEKINDKVSKINNAISSAQMIAFLIDYSMKIIKFV